MPRKLPIDEYDRIHWQILHADTRWSSVSLARDYGIPHGTISRWRREPWVCPVEYVPCKRCGEIVTRSTSNKIGNKRKYHPECYELQLTEWNREGTRERFARLSPWERMWELDDFAASSAEHAHERYAESLTTAVNNRGPWSEEDEAWLVENYTFARIVEVAKHLGRTTEAVRRKYAKLTS